MRHDARNNGSTIGNSNNDIGKPCRQSAKSTVVSLFTDAALLADDFSRVLYNKQLAVDAAAAGQGGVETCDCASEGLATHGLRTSWPHMASAHLR